MLPSPCNARKKTSSEGAGPSGSKQDVGKVGIWKLKIKDIPQVLNSSNQNIGGDQKNWADGVKIEIYDCECQLLSNIEGGGS